MSTPIRDLFRVFGRIGVLSFGGPAAQIALMHEELVEKRGWLDEDGFLGALSFCMLLPGPEAMQLATYAGWKQRGVAGGLIAGLLFVLPGALVIMGLGLAYAYWGGLDVVQAVFLGIKATVVVIVLQALIALSRRALPKWGSWVLAGLGFVAVYSLNLPFPLIILCAAVWGGYSGCDTAATPITPPTQSTDLPSLWRTVLIWLLLWGAPILGLWLVGAEFLTDLAVFFSKLAVVTFGGAYAVLSYMTQTVVGTLGWISTDQMMDSLGLAETTPGPLILVTEFVGLLAGYLRGGAGLAIMAALITLWVTFTPCFLWIFAGAPYVDRILAQPRLRGALQAVTATVVGVILNLSFTFALHTLFQNVLKTDWGLAPDWQSFDPLSAFYTVIAAALLMWLRLPMVWVLTVMGLLAGLVWLLM